MRWAHGLAHLSGHASTFFADWPQPSTVLYGGANLSELAPGTRRFEGYALFVGRLLPHKGLLPLVQCLPPEVPLRVVGRPYDMGYLESVRAAARGKAVTFHLEANDRELREHYAGANVVLQPTLPDRLSAQDRSELLGLVAIEGMASGKPVIVTRCTSLPELVEDGRTGYVVEPGDAAMLSRRVEQLVNDSALAERMGVEARKHVETRFTWDRVAMRALEFYGKLGTLHRKNWTAGVRVRLDEEVSR
jgi:glycosyltransferase involved in cell wall biosynthesis